LAQTKPDWKQRWDKALGEARKEGKVVVWGPPGDILRNNVVQGFKEAFPGIGIEYSGARGPEQVIKLKAERDGGIYSVDVLLVGTTLLHQLKAISALDPIRPALILPQTTDPKHWRDNLLEFADEEEKYNLVFVNQNIPPIVYNLNQVRPEEIDDVNKLLDPKWKGKIVINDPIPGGAGYVLFRWIWKMLGPEKAMEYYRKIRAQAGVVDRDQRRQIEWVAQGKYAILVAPSMLMEQLRQRGLQFGVLGEFKDHGGYVHSSFGSAMLINKAPHPNGAAVFLNWFLGRDGQIAWSKALSAVSRRVDVPTEHLSPYMVPKPEIRYWISHSEKESTRSADEEKILTELFGR
jgi:ABC-type Fe3+ transport system substrate-binding protein